MKLFFSILIVFFIQGDLKDKLCKKTDATYTRYENGKYVFTNFKDETLEFDRCTEAAKLKFDFKNKK